MCASSKLWSRRSHSWESMRHMNCNLRDVHLHKGHLRSCHPFSASCYAGIGRRWSSPPLFWCGFDFLEPSCSLTQRLEGSMFILLMQRIGSIHRLFWLSCLDLASQPTTLLAAVCALGWVFEHRLGSAGWPSSSRSLGHCRFDAATSLRSLDWHFAPIATFLFKINSIYLNNKNMVNYYGKTQIKIKA